MDWKSTPPRNAGFYLASRDRRGDHVRYWTGEAWSTPMDLRDLNEDSLARMVKSPCNVRDAAIEWLCSAVITLDFMVKFPGGCQPVPDDVQVRVICGGVMYQGHAGGYAHWAEACAYTLLEPGEPAPLPDATGLDSAGLLEAAAQHVRASQATPPSAQELANVVRTFNNVFGAKLTETQAWSLLAMLELLRVDKSSGKKAA